MAAPHDYPHDSADTVKALLTEMIRDDDVQRSLADETRGYLRRLREFLNAPDDEQFKDIVDSAIEKDPTISTVVGDNKTTAVVLTEVSKDAELLRLGNGLRGGNATIDSLKSGT